MMTPPGACFDIEPLAKVDGETDAFVDAAMDSGSERLKVRRACDTEVYMQKPIQTTDPHPRSNSLHFAAKHGFSEVIKRMVAMGYTELLWDNSDEGCVPVEVAVNEKEYSAAEVLLRSMDKERAVQLFKRHGETKEYGPRIRLFQLLNDLVDLEQNEEGEIKALELRRFLSAVLDTTVTEQSIDNELLVADKNGYLSTDEEFKGETCYCIIATNKFEILAAHQSFSTLVNRKWRNYGLIAQSISFLFYLVFMTFLTVSLTLAARSSDPNDYSRPVDGFRLFCEIVTFLLVLFDTCLEAKDFYNTYKQSKQSKQSKWHTLWVALKAHFLSVGNMLDFFALLTMWLIIPYRIADDNWQWVFAAITYILNGLRIFKHAIMIGPVAVYILILLKILTRDLTQFLLVMIVVLISFGGGLYFALRGEPNITGSGDFDPVEDTDLGLFPDDTKEIYLAWLTGFRILTEGSVLDYYGKDGPGEYGLLGAFIYWLFVFTVTIILLSVLIAQFSVSFEEQREKAHAAVIVTRADLLQKIPNLFPEPLLTIIRSVRVKKTLVHPPKFGCCTKPLQWVIKFLNRIGTEYKLVIRRGRSKAQEAQDKQDELAARQERLEAEMYKIQHIVQKVCKTVEKILVKVGGEASKVEHGAKNE